MSREIINLHQYSQEYRQRSEITFGNNALKIETEIETEVEEINDSVRLSLEDKKFYDINKNGLGEIAGAFLEEGTNKDLRKRINISDLYPESRIKKDNWEYNKHSNKEREATVNVFNLGKKGFNLVIWISPDDGGDVYKEGRLNIELPVFGQNEWALYGKHVPLSYNGSESFELAKRLIENGGSCVDSITSIEEVRSQPIGFRIEESDKWISECKRLMPEFMEIWDFIENGDDVKNKIKMEKDVRIAMEKANGDNYLFEKIMASMGNEINADGGHGSSYGGGERVMVVSINSNGEISYHLGSKDGLTECKKCGCWYSGEKCPNPKCN